jgi:hypothetical protein
MNSQRRHQLEQNVLANFLEARLSKLQPLMKPVAIAFLAGVGGFLIYSLYQTLTSQKSSVAWTRYYFNLDGDAESFVDLADEFGKTTAGQWSRYTAAISYLRDGVDALYVNRAEGVDSIRKAIAELEPLKNTSIKELRRQSLFGLAQAHESLGELDASTDYYQALLDSDFLAEAEREGVADRITYLKSLEAQRFYSWFNSLDPKRSAAPDLPGDLGIPPESPGIMFDPANLPELPPQGVESPATESADQSAAGDETSGEDDTFIEDSLFIDDSVP